jgi:hypothetical protein
MRPALYASTFHSNVIIPLSDFSHILFQFNSNTSLIYELERNWRYIGDVLEICMAFIVFRTD